MFAAAVAAGALSAVVAAAAETTTFLVAVAACRTLADLAALPLAVAAYYYTAVGPAAVVAVARVVVAVA